jgi:hypothetical protein
MKSPFIQTIFALNRLRASIEPGRLSRTRPALDWGGCGDLDQAIPSNQAGPRLGQTFASWTIARWNTVHGGHPAIIVFGRLDYVW